MTVDKWFDSQDRLVKVLLLIIPFVNWIIEILVRISAILRNPTQLNLIGLIVYIIGGWILGFVDLIFVIIQDKMLFIE
ncbi:MAG: hypothetical protein MJ225_01755 [Bacilli bacterium]|nr:hypothetical protein [Bacilli bacterium]